MRSSARRCVVGLALVSGAWSACRAAPPPEEHAYTGRTVSGRSSTSEDGGRLTVGAGGASQVPSSGGRGGAPSASSGGTLAAADGGESSLGAAGTNDAAGAGSGTPRPPTFSRALLLDAVGQCAVAEIQDFSSLAATLVERTEKNAEAPSDATLQAAREAFLAAMDAFQILEVFRFGPAARATDDPAGRDFRDQIYAWPLGGRCNIETQIVSEGYASSSFASSLINLRGLGALEYLLFYEGDDNACPDYSPLNSQGKWAALGAQARRLRKARYAQAAAEIVLAQTQALLSAWQPDSGNFQGELLLAAAGESKVYPTAQSALNAVSNALFYIEIEDKDLKLGVPLGLSPDCLAGSCPEALESRYARISARNLSQNMLGFRRLFWGCGQSGTTSLGFDDWLRDFRTNDLERRMESAVQDIEKALAALDVPLEDALGSEPSRVREVYDKYKILTDLMKSEFASVLELELPKATEVTMISALGATLRTGARRCVTWASTPVDIAWLAWFRVLFGLTMCVSMWRFLAYGWVDLLFVKPRFHFKYWGLAWVEPLSGSGMHALFWVLSGLALCVAAGVLYRVTSVLLACGLFYIQAVDVSNYLNHYYLALLLSVLLAALPAERAASFDAHFGLCRHQSHVSRVWLYLFRFQVAVVYTFAGIAKAHADWLVHAQPLAIWLGAREDLPLLGALVSFPGAPLVMSWAGFLFDSFVVWFLLFPRTRIFAYAVVIVFHALTRALFPIGMFPVIMVLSALVFFAPDWPRTLVRRLTRGASSERNELVSQPSSNVGWQTPALLLTALYCAAQVAVPLRFLAYGGNVRWHEQGMRFSWRVMVREKNGSVTFVVRQKATQRTFYVSPRRYLTGLQEREMSAQPDLVAQLARHIRRDFLERGLGDVEVRADVWVSLNGRHMARLIDPNVDLSRLPDDLSRAEWILSAPSEAPPQKLALAPS